jgi:transcriptional regulator with XRE-family HTH domain
LSPEAFAARIGRVSASTVRRWESGRHVPLIRQLDAIADAFDVDLAVFFEPSDPKRGPRRRTSRATVLPGQIELLPPRARGA